MRVIVLRLSYGFLSIIGKLFVFSWKDIYEGFRQLRMILI